jgi:hypothetical protein
MIGEQFHKLPSEVLALDRFEYELNARAAMLLMEERARQRELSNES